MALSRKKQVRFNQTDDLNLLREVMAKNPFANKGKWVEVSASLSTDTFKIDSRRARERTLLLLTQYRQDQNDKLKKSGLDEEYSEKELLLEDIRTLYEEEEIRKETDKKKSIENAKAVNLRKRAMESLSPEKDDDDESPRSSSCKKATRGSSSAVLSYLQSRSESDGQVKRDEMDIRREELRLERERFELEKEERKQRMEMDKQHNTMMLNLFKMLSDRK